MRASILIRAQPEYRREAFAEGLRRAGYEIAFQVPGTVQRGDVLLIWNRYGLAEMEADRFEARGGTVLVAENGYLDPGRDAARRWYALAIGGHNGQGRWPIGTPERWPRIAAHVGAPVLAPWRADGTHVLVCPNRSFGRRGYVMPEDWSLRTLDALRRLTQRPVRLRPHPGNGPEALPLEADLKDCWAMVIWASSAGVKALVAGIPVIRLAPAWILDGAVSTRLDEVEAPALPARGAAFERLAWAQWNIEEIASGEPFRRLLSHTGKSESASAA